MSDPVNPYPATSAADQAAYGQQAPYGQQPAYGQAAYAVNPAIEKIRSNASTVRILAILSFLFGGLLLSGGMWFWGNKLVQDAQMLGAPMDVLSEAQSARSAAKICSIIHIVVAVLFTLLMVFFVIIGAMADSSL